MVDYFKSIWAFVGFNRPHPDAIFLAALYKAGYLGDSVIFLKAAEQKLSLLGLHIIKLAQNKLLLAVFIKKGYVFRKSADGEEPARLKIKKLFARKKFNIAENFILDGEPDFAAAYKMPCHNKPSLFKVFGCLLGGNLLAHRLNFYQLVVFALKRHKLVGRTEFNDVALIDNYYFVCLTQS